MILAWQLGSMTGMNETAFWVGNNELTGTLPTQLGEWTALKTFFWVEENELSGSVPSELGRWTEFQSGIQMYNNSFCDEVTPRLNSQAMCTTELVLPRC